jgi:hypothetical protein
MLRSPQKRLAPESAAQPVVNSRVVHLARQSRYLDALIDTSAMNLPGDMAALHDAMARRIGDADYQSMLDIVRDYVGEKRFALGVQLIEGRSDASDIARSYAHLAEAALQTLTAATVAEFEKAHGRIDGSELVILALGRLGGEALTHASDLDLILLFTGNHLAESNGPRALGATQYFNRLAQRVIAVGEATAAEARARGFADVEAAAGDAAALAALINTTRRPEDGALCLAVGEGYALDLAAALRAKGFRVLKFLVFRYWIVMKKSSPN